MSVWGHRSEVAPANAVWDDTSIVLGIPRILRNIDTPKNQPHTAMIDNVDDNRWVSR